MIRKIALGVAVLACLGPPPGSAQHSQPDKIRGLRSPIPHQAGRRPGRTRLGQGRRTSPTSPSASSTRTRRRRKRPRSPSFTTRPISYIGVWCYDNEPDKIIAQKMKWDFEYGNEDNFDHRPGFLWRQAERLSLRHQSQRRPVRCPGHGQQPAGRTPTGTASGMSPPSGRTRAGSPRSDIPFSTLKFSAADEQTWGINFERNIRRKREQVLWQGWSRDATIVQVNRAGTLTGLRGLTRMRIFEFRPYALARREKTPRALGDDRRQPGAGFQLPVQPHRQARFHDPPGFRPGRIRRSDRQPDPLFHLHAGKTAILPRSPELLRFPPGQGPAVLQPPDRLFTRARKPPSSGAAVSWARWEERRWASWSFRPKAPTRPKRTNFSLVRYKQDLGEQSSIGVAGRRGGPIRPVQWDGRRRRALFDVQAIREQESSDSAAPVPPPTRPTGRRHRNRPPAVFQLSQRPDRAQRLLGASRQGFQPGSWVPEPDRLPALLRQNGASTPGPISCPGSKSSNSSRSTSIITSTT